MVETNFSIETQIEHLQHFETGFDSETGVCYRMISVLNSIICINDYEYLSQLVDAIKFIRSDRGLRDLSYSLLFSLHNCYPNLAISVLKSFVFHDGFTASIGCWKDVRNYAKFCRTHSKTHNIQIESILSLYNEQLRQDHYYYIQNQSHCDISPRKYLSFAAKYVPRETKNPEFFDILVSNWFGISTFLITSWHKMTYRKFVSILNRAIDTLEIRLCDKDWKNINAYEIPSMALELNRPNLIKKSEYFKQYYESHDAIVTIPHYFVQNPWRIIKTVFCAKNDRDVIDRMNLYWKKYIEIECSCEKDYYIPVLDLSPNMIVSQRTLCSAIGTALVFAAKSHFDNKILAFSQKVVWIDLTNCPLDIALERILGATMNLQGCVCCVMNLLLDAFRSSGMIENDLEKMKMLMITNAKIGDNKFEEFQKSWSSLGKLDDNNFMQIIL